MPTITRRFEFDYGHRVLGHEGKCRHLHGHRGVAEVTVYAPGLDALGRVVDFGVLKDVVGKWVNDNWDHNLLLYGDDPLVGAVVLAGIDRKPFVMLGNPTAENMAHCLHTVATKLLEGRGVAVMSVRLWETPNSSAVYPDPQSQLTAGNTGGSRT